MEVQAPGVGERAVSERRILLIEDSAVLTRRLIDLLSEPGRVEVAAQASTQSEAVSRLQQGAFDVLVVDIELAEGNGGRGDSCGATDVPTRCAAAHCGSHQLRIRFRP